MIPRSVMGQKRIFRARRGPKENIPPQKTGAIPIGKKGAGRLFSLPAPFWIYGELYYEMLRLI